MQIQFTGITDTQTKVIATVTGAASSMFEHTSPVSVLRPPAPDAVQKATSVVSGSTYAVPETGGIDSVLVEIAVESAGLVPKSGSFTSGTDDFTSEKAWIVTDLADVDWVTGEYSPAI